MIRIMARDTAEYRAIAREWGLPERDTSNLTANGLRTRILSAYRRAVREDEAAERERAA